MTQGKSGSDGGEELEVWLIRGFVLIALQVQRTSSANDYEENIILEGVLGFLLL